ncbi:alpha-glucan family phosphorylase [Candidatus Methylacidithermus pantelleriae]|uniref:Glycogen phosphorylase n=1 Tax=Candidatus Methylacidithermus pantelleriae TaxID=2744239 RepID=A0A8J2BHW6_9BACT|nr:alpha-glucan family phosphorylase [Candidatus Methylacidithermus pantelleriae]CAF0691480.1 Glycogen phosphorylase [Candidatus Methylacidithermus pantelleriae]
MAWRYFLSREVPSELEGLQELAQDLRWTWSPQADRIWRRVDSQLWNATRNPWLILEVISQKRLEELAGDPEFRQELSRQLEERKQYLERPTWFDLRYPSPETCGPVAYFSMEFGLAEALPIYSGGLGILAGDLLKAGSDLGVPIVGVGLLYQQGYFRQSIAPDGHQVEYFPFNDPALLPIVPLRDQDGQWIKVAVELPGRTLHLRAWKAVVGRVELYLLDSNDPLNTPADRTITGVLYGGGPELRLQQEMVLGIGGWRLVESLGIRCSVCHLNEGHAALAAIERAHSFLDEEGVSFWEALWATRGGNLFTTHTPVPAGFDQYDPALLERMLGSYVENELKIPFEDFLRLGRLWGRRDEPFNMAYLALRVCSATNAVSRLHQEVSRRLFAPLFPRWPKWELPIEVVTNGVHVPSWEHPEADAFWNRFCSEERWREPTEVLVEQVRKASDEELWELRNRCRCALITVARKRAYRACACRGAAPEELQQCQCLFDPNTLTLGLARRFTAYKRPTLLLHDPERLVRLINHPTRPVQLVVAGKAHPLDSTGRDLVRQWVLFSERPDVRGKVLFLEDYDMELAAEIVCGVDLWVNTPRRPWEACGTSGMKILAHGGLNVSELDGWWAEAYSPEVGWAIGDSGEHGDDPGWDAQEAEQLYTLLEKEIIPTFYERDHRGIPVRWVQKMRESMSRLTPYFSANRMVRDYVDGYYTTLSQRYARRAAKGGRIARELFQWERELQSHWKGIHFGPLETETVEGEYRFTLPVYLDEISPDWVEVELYAEPLPETSAPVIVRMSRGQKLVGSINGFLYHASVPANRPSSDFTPRVRPFHPEACVPSEVTPILWYR